MVTWLIAFGLSAGACVCDDFAAPAVPLQGADQAERIEDLVRKLGAEDARAREKATEELRKIGKPAVPALQRAAESKDAEVALDNRPKKHS